MNETPRARLIRESIVILFAVVVATWLFWPGAPRLYVPTHLWVLACVPGVIGLLHHLLSALVRFDGRVDSVKERIAEVSLFDSRKARVSVPASFFTEGLERSALRAAPSLAFSLWSALLLTIVFAIPAVLAYQAKSTGLGGLPALAVLSSKQASGGVTGLIFAGVGAYISVMWRMIARINIQALSARFLMTSALRSGAAMLLGFAAGELELFTFLKVDGPQQALYVLVGLFTANAIAALQRRARTVFQSGEQACRSLPLCFVDGLDDPTIDVLEELGLTDVQHLAMSDPVDLSLRSLFPFDRVLDWVDQAFLIAYLREGIAGARQLGIRGAIDFMTTYDASRHSESGEAATKTLEALAQKVGMPKESITLLGEQFWWDYTVNKLYRLWQRTPEDDDSA